MQLRSLALGLVTLLLTVEAASAAPPANRGRWPAVADQLREAKARPGGALEALILANQDFSVLRAEEAEDSLPLPPWLRVWWRRTHPELTYSASDPTGGYPLVLKEIYEWMVHHQDLKRASVAEESVPPMWTDEYSEVADKGVVSAAWDAATVGGNLRISGAQTTSRSESDIRIDFWNPNRIISGSNNIVSSGRLGIYYSSNGGSTWGQTLLPFTSTDQIHSDPTVDWTSDGTAWATAIGIRSVFIFSQLRMRAYKSTNGGATWTFDNTFSGTQTSADKQLMWIDHSAASPYKDRIYMCWHNGTPQFFNRRTPGAGGTWLTTPVQVSGAETTGTAIGCDVKTNSAGTVFLFWPDTGSRKIYMVKSTNGGGSFTAPAQVATTFESFDIGVPSFNGRKMLIYVNAGAYQSGATDNVYLTWNDLSGDVGCTVDANAPAANVASTCKTRVWFTRSTNGGTTWSAPVKINNQAGLNDQFNPALAVDETSGRIGIIYYDTVADAGRKKTHVYFQSSADGGATWSAPTQVSTAQTDETIAGSDSGNQYGDYNSLSGFMGKFFPSWTDRRNNGKEEIWTAPVQDP